jgi:class 3 adenylate cyclase/tetratricopeptide (TPR) repeat protein
MPLGTIAEWLVEVGLEQYTDLFQREQIGLDLVPELTDADLVQLGLPLGPRKRLLKAASALGAAAASTPVAFPKQAERRQLTVMFCDLVGSTQLSQTVDPEALRELMTAYQRACTAVVERYAGHVAQYLGDGLMIYFGWPTAHEDDAERAVRASLEILVAIKEVPASAPLRVRIGIATGPVVVGETGGGDASVPKVAVGETPNLAARLQALAQADQIVVGPTTHRLLGATFKCEDLGEHVLKGVLDPIRPYRVIGAQVVDGRFEATRATTLTPLIGREEEMARLTQRWDLARRGNGQVVLVSGEPGIGKSRVVHELRSHIGGDDHLWLRYQCSPYHRNSAFQPIIEHLQRIAEITHEGASAVKLDRLEQFLKRAECFNTTSASLLAALLSIPTEDRYPPLAFSPQRQKDEIVRLLVALIGALSTQHPLLVVFEDLHWIDASSLEALDLLVQDAPNRRVLLLLTFRPEFTPHWNESNNVTFLGLTRLETQQVGSMISRVAGHRCLPDAIVEHIQTKTDGVPLFVEELTRTLLESDLLRQGETRYELTKPLAGVQIPSTLQDSLMARLDRMPAAKQVAQIGACIGRVFQHELLRDAALLNDDDVARSIDQLVQSGVVTSPGVGHDATYVFKHALVQDIAYESMLKSVRSDIHARLARIMQSHGAGTSDASPEVIAHHYTQAELVEDALPFWLSAGQRALARTALPESVGHLSKALELVQTLPWSTLRDRQELDIRTNLAIAQMAYGGWTYREIPMTLSPAIELAERLADQRSLLIALYYIWLHHLCVPELEKAQTCADRLLTLGMGAGDRATLLVANMAKSATAAAKGEWREAKFYGDQVHAEYRFELDAPLTHLLNHDVLGIVLGWATHYCWALGIPQDSRAASLTYIELAPRVDHTFNLIWSLTGATGGLFYTGHAKEALDCNARARAVARENAMAFAEQGPCNYFGGPALIADGRYDEGYEVATKGVAFWNSSGGALLDPMVNNFRAHALGMLGRVEEGIDLARQTISFTERTNHRTWEPMTYKVLGDLLAKPSQDSGSLKEAEAAYAAALAIARAKGAKGFELIAATALARLWTREGRTQEAFDLLSPIYNWFTGGFETPDLQDASAVLSELR